MGFIHIFKNNQAKQKTCEQASKIKIMREIDARNQHHKKLAKEQQSNLGVVDLLGETQIITATTMKKKNIAPALMMKKKKSSE